MNNLAYGSQDKQNVASKVEELLRKELSSPTPVVYEVEDEGAGETGAGSMLKDARVALFRGSVTRLFTLHFHLMQPRTADLDVHLNRQGVGCYAGSLIYSVVLSKSLGGEVSLGDDGKFLGDAAGVSRLNARKDLLKKCGAFAMTHGGLTGFEVKVPRYLHIAPHEKGAQIVVATLPRSKSMGFGASLGSKEFFEMVNEIETAL